MCTAVVTTAQLSHSSYIREIYKNYFYHKAVYMHTYVSILNQKILKVLLAHKYTFNLAKDGGTESAQEGTAMQWHKSCCDAPSPTRQNHLFLLPDTLVPLPFLLHFSLVLFQLYSLSFKFFVKSNLQMKFPKHYKSKPVSETGPGL